MTETGNDPEPRHEDGPTATSAKAAGTAQPVFVRCAGWPEDHNRFATGRQRRVPLRFPLHGGLVAPGRREGFRGMWADAIRGLVILAETGYGCRGAGAVIPAGATPALGTGLLEISA
jgi:FKBP-type peptidyl-prolyl cis-trans isomerase